MAPSKVIQDIWHGDSVELSTRFAKRKNIAAIITDPPFGVDNQSNMAVTQSGKEHARKIANDENPEVAIKVFKQVMDALLPSTKDDADLYIFTSYQVLSDWLSMTDAYLPPFGFKRKAILVWNKDGPGMGDLNCPWGMGCEFVLYFQKGRREKSSKRRDNVITTPQLRPNELIHPHEKPEALLELLIKASTSEGDLVVDPFGGSGSLARAARRCNRSAVSIELDKKNYDMARQKFDSAEESLFS